MHGPVLPWGGWRVGTGHIAVFGSKGIAPTLCVPIKLHNQATPGTELPCEGWGPGLVRRRAELPCQLWEVAGEVGERVLYNR